MLIHASVIYLTIILQGQLYTSVSCNLHDFQPENGAQIRIRFLNRSQSVNIIDEVTINVLHIQYSTFVNIRCTHIGDNHRRSCTLDENEKTIA